MGLASQFVLPLVSFVIVCDEFVKGIFVEALLRYYPEQKRAYRIIPHNRVEQLLDRVMIPDELPLDCWEVEFTFADSGHRFSDGEVFVFHGSRWFLHRVEWLRH